MSKLKIISKVRINGELYLQEELGEKEFRQIVDEVVGRYMEGISFEKEKTA